MQVRTWVEIFTTERYQEMTHNVDSVMWAALTDDERQDYMAALFEDHRNEVCNGGYEAVA